MQKCSALLLLFFSFFLSQIIWSQELPSEFDAIRIAPLESGQTSTDEDLTVSYDPAQLNDSKKVGLDFDQLKIISTEMSSVNYKSLLDKEVKIPIGAYSSDVLANVTSLNPEELESFLSKKTRFLERVANGLVFLRMKPAAINKIIHIMNDHFYKNAKVITNANTRVYTIQIGVSGGIGFSDWLMNQLRKSPYLSDLSESSGFYFLTNLGVSIVRKISADGKSKFFIEPNIEIRKSTRIFSPFLFAAAGVTGGFTWETRTNNDSVQTASFYKVSLINITSDTKTFGFNTALAAAFPPGGGAVAGVEGKVYRIRITRELLPTLINKMVEFIQKGKSLKCSNLMF